LTATGSRFRIKPSDILYPILVGLLVLVGAIVGLDWAGKWVIPGPRMAARQARSGYFLKHAPYRVTVYSADGRVIRTINAAYYDDLRGGGYRIMDARTGRDIDVSGTVIIETNP
jgi:hypothetical protein